MNEMVKIKVKYLKNKWRQNLKIVTGSSSLFNGLMVGHW